MMKFSSKARQLMLQNGDTLWNMVEGADLEMLQKDLVSEVACDIIRGAIRPAQVSIRGA